MTRQTQALNDSLSRIKDQEDVLPSGSLFAPDDQTRMAAMLSEVSLFARISDSQFTCNTNGNLEDDLVESPRPLPPSLVRIITLNADSSGLTRARS